jgi:hypothetical protein
MTSKVARQVLIMEFIGDQRSSVIYRRLGRPDHHGGRRGTPAPTVAGKARRGRAGDLSGDLLVQLGTVTVESTIKSERANAFRRTIVFERAILP